MTMSELWSADLWCVSLSCPWTRSKSSLSDSRLSQADSSIPSRFHVRNWKVTDSFSVEASTGSDKKLLLELRKVAEASWGSEQVKVTFPWNDRTWIKLRKIDQRMVVKQYFVWVNYSFKDKCCKYFSVYPKRNNSPPNLNTNPRRNMFLSFSDRFCPRAGSRSDRGMNSKSNVRTSKTAGLHGNRIGVCF